ncbi:MAG: VanZ family protein [Burkholderiales bacterium]|nr:VanZ family protein [Phycisphaerae bacterium]
MIARPLVSRRGVRIVAWTWLGLYVVLLLVLTHIPKPPAVFDGRDDKTLHFLAYFALGGLSYFAAAITFPLRLGLSLIVVLGCAVFAALDEITQPSFGRSADVFDWRADVFGVIAGVCVLRILRALISRTGKTKGEAASTTSDAMDQDAQR